MTTGDEPEATRPPVPDADETPAPEAEPAPDTKEPAPAADEASGGGLSVLGAAVTLPWVFLYGITGVWAVALAARAAGRG